MALNKLVKIYRYKIKKLLYHIQLLTRERYRLEQQLHILEQRKEYEVSNCQYPEYYFLLSKYLERYRTEKTKLQTKINSTTQQLAEQQQQLAEQYTEVKKVELLLEGKMLEDKKSQQQQEYKKQDEALVLKPINSN